VVQLHIVNPLGQRLLRGSGFRRGIFLAGSGRRRQEVFRTCQKVSDGDQEVGDNASGQRWKKPYMMNFDIAELRVNLSGGVGFGIRANDFSPLIIRKKIPRSSDSRMDGFAVFLAGIRFLYGSSLIRLVSFLQTISMQFSIGVVITVEIPNFDLMTGWG
jgi:hypothetical protein